MKQFKSRKDKSSIHVYKRGEQYFIKLTRKGDWLKKAKEVGPFKSEGDALLAISTSQVITFSDFYQVYP